MNYKILFVDDDLALLEMLNNYFSKKNYEIILAQNGEDAINKLNENPDIIILDVNMPKLNGFEVCKKIRNSVMVPIIFLTAKVEEQDLLNGLMIGGDDYITKPFSLKELNARIISHINREERLFKKNSIKYREGLFIDYLSKEVLFNNKEIDFTPLEFSIIEFLSMNPKQVFNKDMIYEKTNGYDSDSDSRVITVLIGRIRKKLKAFTKDEWIETVWGMGYRWKN